MSFPRVRYHIDGPYARGFNQIWINHRYRTEKTGQRQMIYQDMFEITLRGGTDRVIETVYIHLYMDEDGKLHEVIRSDPDMTDFIRRQRLVQAVWEDFKSKYVDKPIKWEDDRFSTYDLK